MAAATRILDVQKPVDQSLRETSAWLRVTAQAAARAREPAAAPDPTRPPHAGERLPAGARDRAGERAARRGAARASGEPHR